MRLSEEMGRKAIHLSFLVIVLAYYFGAPKTVVRDVLLAATVLSIGVELLRLHEPRVRSFFRQFFGGLTRRHEKRALLGSTYMLIAAVISVEVFSREHCTAALGYLVLGDTAAALVGRKWGRIHLFGSRKTLEGSLAFVVVSFLFAWGLVQLPWHVALISAVVAAIFEFLPIPLDDNFAIPLSAGFTMKLLS
jgi:dolichol kinase